MSEKTAGPALVNKGQQGGVLATLIVFSLSLALAPISSYFLSLNYLWDGNSTYAAITAIVAANIVLVTYIAASIAADKGDQAADPSKAVESNKTK